MQSIAPIVLYALAAVGVVMLALGLLQPAWRSLRVSAQRETLSTSAEQTLGVPTWAVVIGGLLALATLVLLGQAYFGLPSPRPPAQNDTTAPVANSVLPDASRPGVTNAWYVTTAANPGPGGTLDVGPANKPVQVSALDLVLNSSSHSLLKVQPDGQLVTSEAQEGDRVWLPNAGLWDQSNQKFQGIAAVFSAGRWGLDMTGVSAANANSDFSAGDATNPLPNYTITPADAGYSVTRMTDDDGPFVRVQAARDTAFLQINGGPPITTLDGVPVTVRGIIRAHTSGQFNISVWDVVSDSGKVKSFTNRQPASEDWTTLYARAQQVVYPSPDDYFSIGIVDIKAGDWFDVRELSVFLGAF
ncbi:MAG: hypothetical protein JO057_07590 [Chloroflexi bacterium]|nr:hypothetical protein [Chloroflexota bacterium]